LSRKKESNYRIDRGTQAERGKLSKRGVGKPRGKPWGVLNRGGGGGETSAKKKTGGPNSEGKGKGQQKKVPFFNQYSPLGNKGVFTKIRRGPRGAWGKMGGGGFLNG